MWGISEAGIPGPNLVTDTNMNFFILRFRTITSFTMAASGLNFKPLDKKIIEDLLNPRAVRFDPMAFLGQLQ